MNKLFAIAAFLTVITTFLMWLIPFLYTPPVSFETSINLSSNNWYLSKQWINLVHIPLALIAYTGLAIKLKNRELPKVTLGLIFFTIWGLVEMIGMSVIIFAVNKNWRSNYSISNEAQKLILKSNIETFYTYWDSLFFVLLIAFLLGTIFYGIATFRGNGLEKLLSILFLLAAPLTLCIILSGYFNIIWAGFIVTWIYPILQPVSRFVLGLFLWKK